MGAGSVVLCSTGNRLQVSDYGSALSYPFLTFVWWQIVTKQAIVLQSSDSNSLIVQGPIHTTPQEFENGGFTLKTHQMFSVHSAGGIYKRSNHRSFWNCVWGKEKSHDYGDAMILFSKSSVSKMFSVHTRTQSRRFQIPPASRPFSWRISVDGRPDRSNKAAFSNFSSVACTLPNVRSNSETTAGHTLACVASLPVRF